MFRRIASAAAIAALAASLTVGTGAAADPAECPSPTAPLAFESAIIDEHRAGGEPIVTTHPDGGLLWGSHAGTTHFYTPAAADPTTAAFVENYEGQTYQYRSDDGGASWDFVPRTPISTVDPTSGLPNSGFSDPEFAIDAVGNVYISEINLANIAVSKSEDAGRSYTLQSLAEITLTDRQWMEADEEDMLWFVGNTFGGGSTSSGNAVTGSIGSHELYKSTDGGVTFSAPQPMGGQQSSDIEIDKATGALYELHSERGRLDLWAARDARTQTPPEVDFEVTTIAEDYRRMSSIGPTLDIDAHGNLFVVWDDVGSSGRERGIWFTWSSDEGRTWAEAVQLDRAGDGLAFWPWIAAGEHGAVATWLQHDEPVPDNEPQEATGDWHVMVSLVAGCDTDDADAPGADPAVDAVAAPTAPVRAHAEPVHRATICTGGTYCQAEAIDRRLGDYFANAIDRDGNVYIAVSDTMNGGAVSLPRVIRQVGGPTVGDLYADAGRWGGAAGYAEGTPELDATGPTSCATGLTGVLRSVTRFLGLSSGC